MEGLPSLYIDENLRGLARWLRFLGFDTALALGERDEDLLAHAQAEGRILYTRDRALARAGARLLSAGTSYKLNPSLIWSRTSNLPLRA